MKKEKETLEKIYEDKLKDIEISKIFENKSFDDAIKPYLKKAFTKYSQACIQINLVYDIIFYLKHNPKYYKKYSNTEKTKINQLLTIFENCITNINKTLNDITLCFNIK